MAADARKITSEEHKALGYQEHALTQDVEKLRQAALKDVERIKQQRETGSGTSSLDLNTIGQADASKLISDEHKALGYRPPLKSLTAEVQSAVDATYIVSGGIGRHDIDVQKIGLNEARKLMSEEHRALGYHPSPGSIAATAQAATAKHPGADAGIGAANLVRAALKDAQHTVDECGLSLAAKLTRHTTSVAETRMPQSEEHKTLEHRPAAGSTAAQAQSAVNKRSQVPAGLSCKGVTLGYFRPQVTETLATSIDSRERNEVGL
ncbi:hypothetical protein C8Q79DRAFT_1004649 [Trametes meyenii]|nr:hypothetical protein C8Q79DRAFT_1004649 [Trametes meyenii]